MELVALLWADADGQWRPIIQALQVALPQLYVLGDYNPDIRTGPVIWLRCIVDRAIPDMAAPEGVTPILYLPNVSRQQLRAGGDCPRHLQPLIELQFRGAVWHQQWLGLTVEGFHVHGHAQPRYRHRLRTKDAARALLCWRQSLQFSGCRLKPRRLAGQVIHIRDLLVDER